MTSDQPYTPLTLEFQPDNINSDDPEYEGMVGVVVCEPSLEAPGRIFVGVNPVGQRIGVHMLPDEARRIRDHLTKLLMEKPDESPPPPRDPSYAEPAETIASRIERAVQRAKKRKKKWFLFRLEFQIGGVQGVIGRLRD